MNLPDFGIRSVPPCGDCYDDGHCSMNCGAASPAIKDGEYHIVRDSRQTSYPFDVMRRLNGRDHRINSFKTEIHARYFAAAQNIAAQAPVESIDAFDQREHGKTTT